MAAGLGRNLVFAVLCTAQLASAAVLAGIATALDSRPAPGAGLVAGLVLAIAIAQFLRFDIEFRRQAEVISASEVALVLALLFVRCDAVILAWGLGCFLSELALHPREPRKLVFNVSTLAFQGAVVGAGLAAWTRPPDPTHPTTWLIAAVTAAMASALALGPVVAVFRLHGEALTGAEMLGSLARGIALSALMAAIGVVLGVLLSVHPAAVVLAALLLALLVLSHGSYVRLRRRNADLQAVYRFSAVLNTAREDELLGALLEETRRLLRTSVAEMVLSDWPGWDGPMRARLGPGTELRYESVGRDDAAWVLAASGGAPRIVQPGASRLSPPDGRQATLLAPLPPGSGSSGALLVANRHKAGAQFTADDVRLLAALAGHAAGAIERARLTMRLRYEARHDHLTGLWNRPGWFEAARDVLALQAAAPSQPVAVLHLGLHRFRDINDTLGYSVGDELLRIVAGIVTRAVTVATERASVARFGGDRFVALLPGFDVVAATAVAEAVRREADGVVAVGEVPVAVEVSVGVAVGRTGADLPEQLQQQAEAAFSAARRDLLGVAVFTAERDSADPRRVALAARLRHAVQARDGELFAVFQPKVTARGAAALGGGAALGVETLLRWCHPEEGIVAPAEFIPIAESSGVIRDLTLLVLDAALAQSRRWQESGRPVSVAVNLSTRTLLDRSLPATVARLLHRHRVPAGRLILEITESALMREPTRAAALLRQLSEVGVKLSIDDFGTGYSSLAYLSELPVHEVKIDKTFVARMLTSSKDTAIVRSVVELGHSLGLEVVAEGVEDARTFERLRELGCDTVQGYLLSPPLAADAATHWLDTWSPEQLGPRLAEAVR